MIWDSEDVLSDTIGVVGWVSRAGIDWQSGKEQWRVFFIPTCAETFRETRIEARTALEDKWLEYAFPAAN